MDDRPPQDMRRSHQRSLFWPLVLVGVGIIWLLSNLGILSTGNLWSLARFWPVLLIAIGLDLILGRRRPWVSALIGVLALALILGVLITTPGSGAPAGPSSELETTRLSEPVGAATSAVVKLDVAEVPMTVGALGDSANLIEATLVHRGKIDWAVTGEQRKVVTLGQAGSFGFPWTGLLPGERGNWDIGLTPDLPLDVEIIGGPGKTDLDLERLQLVSLNLDVTSGAVRASLPATEERCRVLIEGGSGRLDVNLAERSQVDIELNVHSGSTDLTVGQGTSLNANVDGGSGRLLITVPEGAALRFTVREGGSGRVTLPQGLQQVSDGNDRDEDTGTWETPDFGKAGPAIEVSVDISSGAIIVRE